MKVLVARAGAVRRPRSGGRWPAPTETRAAGDLARLQGRWVTRAGARHNIVVVLNVEGTKATVDIRTPQGLKFHAAGELRINESVAPRALDWVGFTGLDSQDLPDIPAIYQIDGETFKVCNGGPNSPRPSEFKPGENVLADIHVFERAVTDLRGSGFRTANGPPPLIEQGRRAVGDFVPCPGAVSNRSRRASRSSSCSRCSRPSSWPCSSRRSTVTVRCAPIWPIRLPDRGLPTQTLLTARFRL